ncbi:MAG: ferritin-like domain-containing protein [Archangium sp.]|nr:ferritin-like domain-containing protein [Archangium sp.]
MNVRELFRRALQVSIIGPVALAGCGPDTTGYTPLACDNFQISVRGLQPPVIPDVVQLRVVTNRQFDAESARAPVTVNSDGAACATATDVNACQSSFTALSPMSGFASACLQICQDYHLATTRGDEVKAIASLEELKAFLGPIDTPQEALFIAFAQGYNLSCEQPDRGSAKSVGTGWEVIGTRGIACGAGTAVTRHFLSVTREGELTETRAEIIERGAANCAIGRRPPGLSSSGTTDCAFALGRFFAEAAHLEAASVPAFERLSLELAFHGAPKALREAMLSAALEELEHTRITAELARGFGAQPVAPELQEQPLRSLRALAIDNAAEGCVRETFGALVAQYQALHAEDPRIRKAMIGIAEDETRHAELSWALDRWVLGQLDADDQSAVHEARARAVEKLRQELEAPVEAILVREAGLPTAEIAQRLLSTVSLSLRVPNTIIATNITALSR